MPMPGCGTSRTMVCAEALAAIGTQAQTVPADSTSATTALLKWLLTQTALVATLIECVVT